MSQRHVSDVSSAPDDERSALIERVLLTHLQRRLQGEDVCDDDLVAQHPELMPQLAEQLRLLREIADLREANPVLASAQPSAEGRVLTVRCPHCREPVGVPVDASLSDMTCGDCGSHFGLADDATPARAATFPKQLGRFELIEQLGVGTFGSVWKARDTELDRFVAVKIPRRGQFDPKEFGQLLREARAVAQLSHPNIVSVHEVGRDDETVFIVSDLVRGVTLSAWLAEQQPTLRETCTLCATVADALQHAHEAGVIHRDVKPQNIMLDTDGEPHLLDFGLARRNAGEITMTLDGHVLGTPAYMSPEQARGEAHRAGRQADIYSLGVILFQLLTGELPFRGSASMVMHQVLHEEPPSPRKLNSSVPQDLETICLKCLEKELDKRYGTAKEVADELRRALNGESIHARPISPTDRAVRWCRRNPIAATLILVLIALAVGGPLLAVAQTRLHRAADRAIETANEERYVSDMNLAGHAWNAGDLRRTRELLKVHGQHTADASSSAAERSGGNQGFVWRLLWGLAHADQAAWKSVPDTGTVTCLAISPTSNQLALGGMDGSVSIVDLPTCRQQQRLRTRGSQVVRIVYSSDARSLAAACNDGHIQLWEVGSWREKAVLQGHNGPIRELVFHPDDTQLTSIDNDKIRIWDIQHNGAVKVFDHPEPESPSIAISADATTAATYGGLNNTVRFWRLQPGPLEPRTLPTQQAVILSVLLSSDGNTAFVSTHDSWVSRWDVETLSRLVTYSQTMLISCLVLSADGQRLVTAGSDNLVRVWQVQSGRELQVLRGHPGIPAKVAIAADATSLAAISADGTLKVRSIGTEKEGNRLLHNGIVVELAVSPDGRTLATTDPNHKVVKLWEMPSREAICEFEGKQNVAFSLDGKWLGLMSFDGRLRLMDRSTIPYRSQFDKDVGSFSIGHNLTFSHDSKMLAFHGKNNTVTLWDVDKQHTLRTLPEHHESCATAFGAHDKVIATASRRLIRIWDVTSGRPLALIPGQAEDIRHLCFSPNGKQLAATSGGTELRWWDVSDPADPHELPPLRGHTADIATVAFSPDGTLLATGGYDSALRLWDVALGRQLTVLRDHSSLICSLAWSPDGNTLYTGSGDASCRIWHAPSWMEIEADEARPSTAGQRP